METPLINGGADEGCGGGDGDGDYPPLKSWRGVRSMVWTETEKLWRVAGPLAFQILCQFGTNSMTSVFVGHIGNLQLSAVSISLSVIGTFYFGFMVSFLLSHFLFPFWVFQHLLTLKKVVVAFDFSTCPMGLCFLNMWRTKHRKHYYPVCLVRKQFYVLNKQGKYKKQVLLVVFFCLKNIEHIKL